MTELYSPKEVAKVLKITPRGVRKILQSRPAKIEIDGKTHRIEVKRINGRVYVTEQSYKALVALVY